jgi:alpha-mannosidase
MARTSMIKTRSLRRIASMVDVSTMLKGRGEPVLRENYDVGGGPGDISADGSLSRRGAGGSQSDPFVIFNSSAWHRTELVTARIWDRTWPGEQIGICDDTGRFYPAQVTERGNYWGHNYIGIALLARDVPALGWRSYNVVRDLNATGSEPEHLCSGDGRGTLENEFLKIVVEPGSGSIVHLIDKRQGVDLVPASARLGVLEYFLEAPHPMTAWVMGQIKDVRPFTEGGVIDCPANGPYMASVRVRHTLNDSKFSLTISLAAGVPRVDFTLEVNWLERGSAEVGVPMLRVAFPLAVTDAIATFEAPNGHVTRTTDPRTLSSYTGWLGGAYWPATEPVDPRPGDVPAQKWADLTGTYTQTVQRCGATVLNDTKYSYNVDGNTMRLTLLRSSYDPDPLPELGSHVIRFAVQPHDGTWTPSASTRAGYEFNNPFDVVGTDVHQGSLAASAGFAEILTPNIMLSGMKKAEDSDTLIVRLYEMNGQATRAQVRLSDKLCGASAPAVQTDLMEQPISVQSARMQDGVLSVDLPAFGLVTVKIR